VPFDARRLARHFEQVAFFTEYTQTMAGFEARPAPALLRRWEGPVRIGLAFGPNVPADRRARDRAEVAALADRLARLTGLPVALTGAGANLVVIVADADARRDVGWLAGVAPGLPDGVIAEIATMPRATFCAAFSIEAAETPSVFTRAVVAIKDEQPPLLRRNCFHEELAQALGLSNDSPRVRPSVFNDVPEFALLTRHDELLLRMLHDPALQPGMDIDTARPIVRDLAEAVLAGES
jgi:hypothetical protein